MHALGRNLGGIKRAVVTYGQIGEEFEFAHYSIAFVCFFVIDKIKN